MRAHTHTHTHSSSLTAQQDVKSITYLKHSMLALQLTNGDAYTLKADSDAERDLWGLKIQDVLSCLRVLVSFRRLPCIDRKCLTYLSL
jgi:hypothetical protein